MLSEDTRNIVKASVPVLLNKGNAITKIFYRTMLEDHKELRNMFNGVNQAKGAQPTALATTVLAAAKHIDDLSVLMPHVQQIGHKHRSLQVQPEQYAIVGKYLLNAIKEVLGDAATPQLLAAWQEAYGAIADVFISVEKNMYKETPWKGWQPFEVTNREIVGHEIVELTVKPKAESGIDLESIDLNAGQYITLNTHPIRQNNRYDALRHYSLTSGQAKNGLQFAVRYVHPSNKPIGLVSEYLYKDVTIGDVLLLSAPAGDFSMDKSLIHQNEIPLVAVGCGIGTGPLVGMVETQMIENPNRPVVWIQSTCDNDEQTFKKKLNIFSKNLNKYEEIIVRKESKPFEIDALFRKNVPLNADVYVCGSIGYMQSMVNYFRMLGLKDGNIHYEPFEPKMPTIKT